MGLSVKVDLEAYPKGKPLGIVGIGVVNNGESVELDGAAEEQFFNINGDTVTNVLKDQEGMEVSGSAEFVPPKAETTYAPAPEQQTQPAETTPPDVNEGGEQ